jgi:AraC-like DNA-binding protein
MLERALYLLDSTQMNTDPFSDILKLTHAQSLTTGGFTAGGSWALRFPAPDKIKFMAVLKGNCWVHIDGQPPSFFETGDVGLLTARRSFVMGSDLDTEPLDAMSVFQGSGTSPVVLGDGEDFTQIGGHVLLDPASGQLLAGVLPPWIQVPAASPQATTFRWMLDQLVQERKAARPGSQLASAHLSQLLFIQILRAWLESAGPMSASWLRALSDPRIAPALHLMHGDPTRAWGLEELARACAMSRTTFAQHFRTVAGIAPLTYLGEWRMRLAERALREETTSVAVIGQSVGYSSESAFSNAFKRINGQSPRAYREQSLLQAARVR